jgi:hypothetical protein
MAKAKTSTRKTGKSLKRIQPDAEIISLCMDVAYQEGGMDAAFRVDPYPNHEVAEVRFSGATFQMLEARLGELARMPSQTLLGVRAKACLLTMLYRQEICPTNMKAEAEFISGLVADVVKLTHDPVKALVDLNAVQS